MPSLPATPTPVGQTGLEEDDEMREVFLEEAHEVIAAADQALSHWRPPRRPRRDDHRAPRVPQR